MRWWTSDLHFGHEEVIRYARRPFEAPTDMDLALIETWNATVDPGDEVWVLGDFAVGKTARHLSRTSTLRGRKTLVTGNRDLCWAGKGKGVKRWTSAYRQAGFDQVLQGPVGVELGGRRLLADHFPYYGDPRELDRYVDWRPPDAGAWLLHGHIHGKWRQAGRQLNVGVDAWGGRPVSDEELTALIDGGPNDLAPLPWPAPPAH